MNITLQQDAIQQKNLQIFLKAFSNQTNTLVKAIEEQKKVFIETLEKSQNISKISQNLTKENQQISLANQNLTEQRNLLLKLQIQQFDNLIANLNGSGHNNTNNK